MFQQAASSSTSSAKASSSSSTINTVMDAVHALEEFIEKLPSNYAAEKGLKTFQEVEKRGSNLRGDDVNFLTIIKITAADTLAASPDKRLNILRGALLFIFLRAKEGYKCSSASGPDNRFLKLVMKGSYLYKAIGIKMGLLDSSGKNLNEEKMLSLFNTDLIYFYDRLCDGSYGLSTSLTYKEGIDSIRHKITDSINLETVLEEIKTRKKDYSTQLEKLNHEECTTSFKK